MKPEVLSTGWQKDVGVSVGVGAKALRGTDVLLQDPNCQDLPTKYEMSGNVTRQM